MPVYLEGERNHSTLKMLEAGKYINAGKIFLINLLSVVIL